MTTPEKDTPPTPVKRVPWCREHRRARELCDRYGSTHLTPR